MNPRVCPRYHSINLRHFVGQVRNNEDEIHYFLCLDCAHMFRDFLPLPMK